MPPTPTTSLRLTPAERDAVREAMRLRRLRTGEDVRFAAVVREGLAKVCAEEGVAWPGSTPTTKES